MEVKYSFICDFANADASGKVNAVGIFKNIHSASFPFVYPGLTYVASLAFSPAEAGKHRFRIIFMDYDGKNIAPPREVEIDVKKAEGKSASDVNLLLQFAKLNFDKPGPVQIDLIVDNRRAAGNTFYVNQKGTGSRLQ